MFLIFPDGRTGTAVFQMQLGTQPGKLGLSQSLKEWDAAQHHRGRGKMVQGNPSYARMQPV
jgi:hypothetical protein